METLKPISPEFEQEVRTAMAIPDDYEQEFLMTLKKRILDETTPQRMPRRAFIARPVWGMVLAILVVVIVGVLAIGPQRVIAAVRQVFGYIPDIGFVEDSSVLRALETPVTLEREGIRLTVEQAVAYSNQTVIFYTVEGLSPEAASSQGEAAQTGSFAHLLLTDGSSLSQTGGDGNGWETGYQARLVFPPLKAGIEELTLVIPRLQTMPAGAAPEDWQLSLRLKPDPEGLAVLPVFEIRSPTPTLSQPVQNHVEDAPQNTPTAEATRDPQEDVQFIAEKVVLMGDYYLYTGRVEWSREDYSVKAIESDQVKFFDADGNELYIKPASFETERTDPQANWIPWAYQTGGTAFRGPLTLTIQSLWLEASPQALFTFDPGPDPQIGQTWSLNQRLEVAGYSLQITSARYATGKHGPELTFEIQAVPGVTHVELIDAEHFFGSSGSGAVNEVLTATVFYPDGMPEGPITLTVNKIGYRLAGPWEIPLQLP